MQYFRLCAVTEPREHPTPADIFTKQEVEAFFMLSGGKLIPREVIIGGGSKVSGNVNTDRTRKPIVVY